MKWSQHLETWDCALCDDAVLKELLAAHSCDALKYLHDFGWSYIQLRPRIMDDVCLSKLWYYSCLSTVHSATLSVIQFL